MFADNHLSSHSTFLLASPEPALLASVEPALLAAGARVEVVLSAQAALNSMKAVNPPALVLLDATLPGMPMGASCWRPWGLRARSRGSRLS